MVSGSSVHRKIRDKIREVERDHERLSSKVYSRESKIRSLTNERENCYIQLAEIYLPELDAKSIKQTLRDVQGAVERIYEDKQARRKIVEERMESAIQKRAKLEEKLDCITEQLNEAAAERDQVQEAISKELGENGFYQNLFSQAEQAKELMAQNKRRVKEIELEAKEKLPAYKESKLFMYLLKREFGTENYKHNGIVKRLDQWVANIVDYKQSKKNYDFLCKMPDLVRAEADRRGEELKELAAKVNRIEKEAAEKYGLQEVIEKGQEISEKRGKAMNDIEKTDQKYIEYAKERKELEDTRGTYHQDAIGKLKKYLKGDDIDALKRRALDTPNRKDDKLVERIEEIDAEIKNQRKETRSIKKDQRKIDDQLNVLNRIESKYTRNDYESDRSYFDSSFDITALLAGYLIGKYTEDSLWREISSSQNFKPKPRPVFRPTYRRRSIWDDDDDDGGSIFTSTRSSGWGSDDDDDDDGWGFGGFGGGGFSSGGGFGGGGFSSGSGF